MLENREKKKRLLLHTCCAPCSPYVIELLRTEFEVDAFFYNPNIHPLEEYKLRLEEMRGFLGGISVELLVGDYDADQWFRMVKGMEREKEGGRRCELCYRMRLKKTAFMAQTKGFQYYTTTLTVSPHKNAKIINQIGSEIKGYPDVAFYEADFKKRDGFKKSCELSNRHGFYRQNYCGCIYSKEQK